MKLKKFGESVKGRVDVVVSLGIGGSFLGKSGLESMKQAFLKMAGGGADG